MAVVESFELENRDQNDARLSFDVMINAFSVIVVVVDLKVKPGIGSPWPLWIVMAVVHRV
jgi:hypothetical protein